MATIGPTSSPRVLFLGRCTLDALYWLDRLPDEDSKVYARQFHAAPGGPAANAALTHARLGGESLLISAVGGGPWADAVRAEFARSGIRLLDLAAATAYQTPLTTVLLGAERASRTIVNPPLENVALTALPGSWERAVPAEWGAIPPVILTDGFHLAETLPLLAACRTAGAEICLDGGSWKPGTDLLAPLLTTAICSERFTLPGVALPGAHNGPESLFAWFAAQGVAQIAVTRGPRSILGWERERRFEIAIEAIAAADTLGAGDVLHGAYCHFRALGAAFEPALRHAARVATESCKWIGIQLQPACNI
jgi:sugar/nucleoside kinase (ribokinase family)